MAKLVSSDLGEARPKRRALRLRELQSAKLECTLLDREQVRTVWSQAFAAFTLPVSAVPNCHPEHAAGTAAPALPLVSRPAARIPAQGMAARVAPKAA